MNNRRGLTVKGFLTVMVILGLIVLLLLYYFYNQRRRNFITMAQDYISGVRMLATADRIFLPSTSTEKVIITISQIEPAKQLRKSPFEEKWNLEKSYIIISNSGSEYSPHYVYSIALEDEAGNCIELTKEDELHRNIVTTNCSIEEHSETNAVYIN